MYLPYWGIQKQRVYLFSILSMKRRVIKAVLFVVFVISIVAVVQWLVDYAYNKTSKNKFNLLLNHDIDEEVMIFGSSVAYVHFDPATITKYTGLSCYNMGWDGIFFLQYEPVIKEYISFQKKCKCIVIACDFDNLGKTNLITRPDLFMSHLSNRYVYQSLSTIEPDNINRAKFIPGYKLGLLSKTFYSNFITKQKNDKNNGFEAHDWVWKDTTDITQPFNTRFEEDVYSNFSNTVKAINAKGIKVVIVLTPMFHKGYRLVKNAEKIKNCYKALDNHQAGVYVLDYSTDSMGLNRQYFYNNSHLNSVGAAEFSEKFSVKLKEILR